MTDRQAFLHAICEHAHDDAPRLIYADWLDEHGEPDRAEFIRAQIELARPPAPRTRTRCRELERRVKALWKDHGPVWAEQPGGGRVNLWQWERGFCAHYYAKNLAALSAELPERMMETPIQHVRLQATRDDIAILVTMPLLARLRSLMLFSVGLPQRGDLTMLRDADVALLANCPYLSRLEGLDLTQHDIGPEGLYVLTNATRLPALRDLALYRNRWDDVGLRVVAASPMAARLRSLHAGGGNAGGITAAGARVLATCPALANLRVLNLDNTEIGDAGARHIAASAHLSGLTELWLHSCEIRDAGVKAIAASPHLADLEVLDLSTNWTVGHAAAAALVESSYLKKIRRLDLWRCERLTPADERMLRKRFRSRVNFQRSY